MTANKDDVCGKLIRLSIHQSAPLPPCPDTSPSSVPSFRLQPFSLYLSHPNRPLTLPSLLVTLVLRQYVPYRLYSSIPFFLSFYLFRPPIYLITLSLVLALPYPLSFLLHTPLPFLFSLPVPASFFSVVALRGTLRRAPQALPNT